MYLLILLECSAATVWATAFLGVMTTCRDMLCAGTQTHCWSEMFIAARIFIHAHCQWNESRELELSTSRTISSVVSGRARLFARDLSSRSRFSLFRTFDIRHPVSCATMSLPFLLSCRPSSSSSSSKIRGGGTAGSKAYGQARSSLDKYVLGVDHVYS